MHTDQLDPSKDAQEDNKQAPVTYASFLKNNIEKTNEVMSISKLHLKVLRQRREIESWAMAKK